jgi:hypothetical protein
MGRGRTQVCWIPLYFVSIRLIHATPCTGGIPQSAVNQASQGNSNFSDGSGPLFNMYVKMAEEEDNKMTQRWQKDADGILVFVSFHDGIYPVS